MISRNRKLNNIPVKCRACNEMITTEQVKINHHKSYNPPIKVPVHDHCHAKIHHGSAFNELLPSPKQLIRYLYNGENVYLKRWNGNKGRQIFSEIVPLFFKKIDKLQRYYKKSKTQSHLVSKVSNN